MNSIGNSIFVIVLVCIDSAAVGKLLVEGPASLDTALMLHVLVCIGAALRGGMHPTESAAKSSRTMMAINCGLTCWFAPVLGVLVILFYDHAEPVESVRRVAVDTTGFLVGNPVTGGGRPARLDDLKKAGLFPLTNSLFNGERIGGEEGTRIAVSLRKNNSLLLLRRLASMLRGRHGIVIQTGLQQQLESDRRRVLAFSEAIHGFEQEVNPVWHIIAAEGERSLIERGVNSVSVERPRLERIAEHLESAIVDGTGDAWVVNRYVDALIKLEYYEEAYRVVMECSVVAGVPVRLHLARIRSAEGQWSGIHSLTSDTNNRDWAGLGKESKKFWGF